MSTTLDVEIYLAEFQGAVDFLAQAAEADDSDTVDACLDLFAEAALAARRAHRLPLYPFIAQLLPLEAPALECIPAELWLQGTLVWLCKLLGQVHKTLRGMT